MKIQIQRKIMRNRLLIHSKLLNSIKKNLTEIKCLLDEVNSHWNYEDPVYRYYHFSFKSYYIQSSTSIMIDLFKRIYNRPLNEQFINIIKDGTHKFWKQSDNKNWHKVNRPMFEAYFHAKFFLEMMYKYGRELKNAPEIAPSGWAAVLYLYNIR